MTNREIKQQFRPLLPKGFVRVIKRRLLDRGVTRSIGFISEVCNPEKEEWDNEIVTEALDLAANQKAVGSHFIQKAKKL